VKSKPKINRFKNIQKSKVWGILNVTPDSFFDGGKYIATAKAVKQALQMIKDGAEVIDIGGESSRPGAKPISAQEELKRVLPVIKSLRTKNKKILVSIDTVKSAVAEEALKAGANIVNDISGLTADSKMLEIVKKYQCQIVIMHRQGDSRVMQKNPKYKNCTKEVSQFFKEQIKKCLKAGIKKQNIILDPGIGFGKTLEHNLELIGAVKKFKKLNYPLLYGVSRKSMIGQLFDAPVDQRLLPSVLLAFYLAQEGVEHLRVHDVLETKQALSLVSRL
jgi:dihydropteroate synthase